jgi:hypothetical protein
MVSLLFFFSYRQRPFYNYIGTLGDRQEEAGITFSSKNLATDVKEENGGVDGARTRDLRRDRPAF